MLFVSSASAGLTNEQQHRCLGLVSCVLVTPIQAVQTPRVYAPSLHHQPYPWRDAFTGRYLVEDSILTTGHLVRESLPSKNDSRYYIGPSRMRFMPFPLSRNHITTNTKKCQVIVNFYTKSLTFRNITASQAFKFLYYRLLFQQLPDMFCHFYQMHTIPPFIIIPG